MNDLKEKSIEDEVAEIIENTLIDGNFKDCAKKILALFQMEVECTECGGKRMLIECIHCPEYKRTGNDYRNCHRKCPVIECPTCKGKKTETVPFKSGVKGVCL